MAGAFTTLRPRRRSRASATTAVLASCLAAALLGAETTRVSAFVAPGTASSAASLTRVSFPAVDEAPPRRRQSLLPSTASLRSAPRGRRTFLCASTSAASSSTALPSTPQPTHLIAIPLESAHDLLLELESIQRAVLYHCPLLIDACVAPVATRLPLLYVDAGKGLPASMNDDGDGDDGTKKEEEEEEEQFDFGDAADIFEAMRGAGRGAGEGGRMPGQDGGQRSSEERQLDGDPIAKELHRIVAEVLDEVVFVRPGEDDRLSDFNDDADADASKEEEDIDTSGANDDGVHPLLLSFRGLEMDGDDNSVLHAVAAPGGASGGRLRRAVDEITRRVEDEFGWTVTMPPDEPQGGRSDGDGDNGTQEGWRARVPFMRLPPAFKRSLPQPEEGVSDAAWSNMSEDERANLYRSPEEGGNGISPLFWYRWWNDELCEGRGVRMREVAVYERTERAPYDPVWPSLANELGVSAGDNTSSAAGEGLDERSFYVPHLRTPLPRGNSALSSAEAAARRSADDRIQEQMKDAERGFASADEMENEMRKMKLEGDRRMLEAVYGDGAGDIEEAVREADLGDMAGSAGEGGSRGVTVDEDGVINVESITEVGPVTADSDDDSDDADADDEPTFRRETRPVVGPDVPTSAGDDYAIAAARAVAEARAAMAAKKDEDGSDESIPNADAEATVDNGEDKTTADAAVGSDDNDNVDLTRARDIVSSIKKPIDSASGTPLDPTSTAKKEGKIPWQDNPVFKDWQSRVTVAESSSSAKSRRVLPPYPSEEHFVGAWRVVNTPRGPSFDEEWSGMGWDGTGTSAGEGGSSARRQSENLILRVDKTTAGGPILDRENMHRAAGGTWRFFEAEWSGQTEDGEEQVVEQTRLRVRLVIPPKKERIMVLEGEVKRGVDARPGGIKKEDDLSAVLSPGSNPTFGIPETEEAARRAARARAAYDGSAGDEDGSGAGGDGEGGGGEVLPLTCSGECWIEDAVTGKNRVKLGRFSLSKLKTPNPDDVVISIPGPTRIQD